MYLLYTYQHHSLLIQIEAADADLDMVICITEHIPVVDMVKVKDIYKVVKHV